MSVCKYQANISEKAYDKPRVFPKVSQDSSKGTWKLGVGRVTLPFDLVYVDGWMKKLHLVNKKCLSMLWQGQCSGLKCSAKWDTMSLIRGACVLWEKPR